MTVRKPLKLDKLVGEATLKNKFNLQDFSNYFAMH